MRRYCSAFCLSVISVIMISQIILADTKFLQIHMDQGRIAINARDVKIGRILEELSKRSGIRVVIDEDWAGQTVSLAVEAKGVEEAIWEVLRRTGRGNYAIMYSNASRQFKTFRIADGNPEIRENNTASVAAQPPAATLKPQGTLFPEIPATATVSGAGASDSYKLPPSFRRAIGDIELSNPQPSQSISVDHPPQGKLIPSFQTSTSEPRFNLPPSFKAYEVD